MTQIIITMISSATFAMGRDSYALQWSVIECFS